MDKLFQVLLVVLFVVGMGCTKARQHTGPLRTIKIQYLSTSKSDPTLYYGETYYVDLERRRMKREIAIPSVSDRRKLMTSEVEVYDGAQLYRFSPSRPEMGKIIGNYPNFQIPILVPRDPAQKPIGKRSILGVTCDIYENTAKDLNQKRCLWEGIKLQDVMTSSNSDITTEATVLEMNPPFDETFFNVSKSR